VKNANFRLGSLPALTGHGVSSYPFKCPHLWAKSWLENAVTADSTFQKAAKDDFAFHAGRQWSQPEKQAMYEQQRPALTFNLIKPSVDLIMRVNEENRIDVKAQPTESTGDFLAEVLNDAVDKMREIEESEEQEDDTFENAVICGRGFCAIDVYPDPKRPGQIMLPTTSIQPHEIRLDPAGRKSDLSDHHHIFWEKCITYEDFAINYPEHLKDIEDIALGHGSLYPEASSSTGDK
jgi:hypothetical protein